MRKVITLNYNTKNSLKDNDFYSIITKQCETKCGIKLEFTPEQWKRFKEFIENAY